MRLRFWRCDPDSPKPGPRSVPQRPAWATAPTDVFPTTNPGRAGNLTPAQTFRANGGRW
ncbi:hypothetical protein GA0070622_5308 [Micromonospora sediminicola]|uniref:Uncharacterized protein n=1 Tax=Micromonospora sediminicola TaxID=946078 RepID=A0A1A9BH64_9ACTN|nr:hypothetical protein GA0070622_5308 [Micromonospora sediminicola]